MPEIITTRTLYPDSIEIGTPGKGGCIHIFFDSGNLAEAQQRIENVVKIKEFLLAKLGGA